MAIVRATRKSEGTLEQSIVTRRLLLGGSVGLLAAPAILRAQENTIKIGFPVPLTGPYGTEAQDQVRCAQLAVAEFNEAGGLNGQKAELLVRDDKLDPGEAATRTLELIERDKVNFIVGSLSASVQLAVNNVTKQRKVLYNSISQSDQITAMPDWSRYTFHEGLTPHMTAGAVGATRSRNSASGSRSCRRRLCVWRGDGGRVQGGGREGRDRGGGRDAASAGHDGFLDAAAADPGAEAGHAVPVQFRARPADLGAAGDRFRAEAQHADRDRRCCSTPRGWRPGRRRSRA